MNNIATINGLIDGISVLENNRLEEPAFTSDILYNDKEPISFDIDEFAAFEYRVEDFGEAVTLLSTITMEEALTGKKDIER
jgi:hypothetical protein